MEAALQDKADKALSTGLWGQPSSKLREWDPAWADACLKMSTNPWTNGVRPRKTVELIRVALNAACTNLNAEGTRRHIRAALEAGATRKEILMILKMGSWRSIPAALGGPILLEEAKAGGVESERSKTCDLHLPATRCGRPACGIRHGNRSYNLGPAWTDEFMAAAIPIYASSLLLTTPASTAGRQCFSGCSTSAFWVCRQGQRSDGYWALRLQPIRCHQPGE